LSIDKNERHRGKDERDSPLPLELEGVAEEGELVIGGKERDQAEDEATAGLGEPRAVESKPGEWLRR
jgi:hypothetical protein